MPPHNASDAVRFPGGPRSALRLRRIVMSRHTARDRRGSCRYRMAVVGAIHESPQGRLARSSVLTDGATCRCAGCSCLRLPLHPLRTLSATEGEDAVADGGLAAVCPPDRGAKDITPATHPQSVSSLTEGEGSRSDGFDGWETSEIPRCARDDTAGWDERRCARTMRGAIREPPLHQPCDTGVLAPPPAPPPYAFGYGGGGRRGRRHRVALPKCFGAPGRRCPRLPLDSAENLVRRLEVQLGHLAERLGAVALHELAPGGQNLRARALRQLHVELVAQRSKPP